VSELEDIRDLMTKEIRRIDPDKERRMGKEFSKYKDREKVAAAKILVSSFLSQYEEDVEERQRYKNTVEDRGRGQKTIDGGAGNGDPRTTMRVITQAELDDAVKAARAEGIALEHARWQNYHNGYKAIKFPQAKSDEEKFGRQEEEEWRKTAEEWEKEYRELKAKFESTVIPSTSVRSDDMDLGDENENWKKLYDEYKTNVASTLIPDAVKRGVCQGKEEGEGRRVEMEMELAGLRKNAEEARETYTIWMAAEHEKALAEQVEVWSKRVESLTTKLAKKDLEIQGIEKIYGERIEAEVREAHDKWKEQHGQVLRNRDDEHEAKLNELKDKHEEEAGGLRQSHENEKGELKTLHGVEIKGMQEKYSRAIKHHTVLIGQRDGYKKQLDEASAMVATLQIDIEKEQTIRDNDKTNYDEHIFRISKRHEENMEALRERQENETITTSHRNRRNLEKLRERYEKEIEQQSLAHKQEMKEAAERHQNALNDQEERRRDDLERLQKEKDDQFQEMQRHIDETHRQMRESIRDRENDNTRAQQEMSAKDKSHATAMQEQWRKHSLEVSETIAKYATQIQQLEAAQLATTTELEQQIAALEAANATEIKALEQRYIQKFSLLKSGHATQLEKLQANQAQAHVLLKEQLQSYSGALLTRDIRDFTMLQMEDLKPLSDGEIKSRFEVLKQEVDSLSRLEWKPNPKFWTNQVIKRLGSNQRVLRKQILQDNIWSLLHAFIFCSPFRLFGQEGESLELLWNQECGEGKCCCKKYGGTSSRY
jgi:hypothetical protein